MIDYYNQFSGYPSLGQLARFIKQQNPVYVRHQLLLIKTLIAQMPPATLSLGFPELGELLITAGHQHVSNRIIHKPVRPHNITAATKPENQSTQNKGQRKKTKGQTLRFLSIFHHFSLFKINQFASNRQTQQAVSKAHIQPPGLKPLYQSPEWLSRPLE